MGFSAQKPQIRPIKGRIIVKTYYFSGLHWRRSRRNQFLRIENFFIIDIFFRRYAQIRFECMRNPRRRFEKPFHQKIQSQRLGDIFVDEIEHFV